MVCQFFSHWVALQAMLSWFDVTCPFNRLDCNCSFLSKCFISWNKNHCVYSSLLAFFWHCVIYVHGVSFSTMYLSFKDFAIWPWLICNAIFCHSLWLLVYYIEDSWFQWSPKSCFEETFVNNIGLWVIDF